MENVLLEYVKILIILYLAIGAFVGYVGMRVGFSLRVAILMMFIWGPVFVIGLIDEVLWQR